MPAEGGRVSGATRAAAEVGGAAPPAVEEAPTQTSDYRVAGDAGRSGRVLGGAGTTTSVPVLV